MKQRILDRILNTISCLPLIGFFVIPFMPLSFPSSMAVTERYPVGGSRYEYILYFFIPIAAGWCAYFWLREQRKKTKDCQMRNKRFVFSLFIMLLLAYDVLILWFIVHGFQVLQRQATTNIGCSLEDQL